MKKLIAGILLLIVSVVFCANEVQTGFEGGNILYAIFRSNTSVWNEDDGAFETWADANIADYDNPMTDSNDLYIVDFNSSITVGTYSVIIYQQAGGTPHISNDKVLGTGTMFWTGSAEITLASLDTLLDAIISTGSTGPWTTGAASGLTKEVIRAEMDANSTQFVAIVDDTNELQTDWADGGRLDLIIDTVKKSRAGIR